jgi:integrase
MDAARANRYGHRDATAILLAYRHGLRASEVVSLRWDDIDLATGRMHVRRAKGGLVSVHPVGAKESRALRRLQREAIEAGCKHASPYVFVSERGAPLSVAGYQRMVARTGEAARFPFLPLIPSAGPSSENLRRAQSGFRDQSFELPCGPFSLPILTCPGISFSVFWGLSFSHLFSPCEPS